ncbi:MAG TPA: N-acetylmuramoyl-L-alanine amidase [Acidimicrobiales bacterium]|jgi:hypothetical protein|nr:N-acetylmuramoyl-L-alanine amidase [Trebonia sp.]
MTLKRVAIPSPNYSSRGGSAVSTIVLHTAEGATTYQSLGSFFANPSSGVSSHVGIDDTANTVGEYVRRDYKAWTAASANPWACQAELCAFAAWDSAEWNRHPNMLANTAAWIAEEAAYFGIPIIALSDAQAQDPGTRGVCQHINLGSMGGGHVDCDYGTGNFPFGKVLDMAKGGAAGPPPTPPPAQFFGNGAQEDTDMAICSHPNGKRIDMVTVAPNGSVDHYWTDNDGDLGKMHKENLGGGAKTVSCCWLDDGRFRVVCHGTNDTVYQILSNDNRWTGWAPIPNTAVAP